MDVLKIENNSLIYQCESAVKTRDISFKILIDKIKIIGFINRMIGDDDSNVLVFIDNELKKSFVNMTYEHVGDSDFKKWLTEQFGINYEEISSSKNYDYSMVIFPKEKFGQKLYKKDFKSALKRVIGMVHPADGLLSF